MYKKHVKTEMTVKRVLASGFFDPIHRGHINYLREAKKLGDILIVHVHRDECCIKKKGYCFQPLSDRVAILESLKYVDEVVVCKPPCDLTVAKALEEIKPDIFAKGGDRTIENMPQSEIEVCKRLGIQIVFGVGGAKIQSSSWICRNFLETIKTQNQRPLVNK
jgi:D-beta-D-heptose 7-phosphate kinase/D-beta-D-heptose 1-phosphate adenosyltransferase